MLSMNRKKLLGNLNNQYIAKKKEKCLIDKILLIEYS